MPSARSLSRVPAGSSSAQAVAKRGRDLFDASPAATVGQKRRRSSSGGASAAAAAGGPKSARKTLCACGCPAPGTRRSPPCDEASAADPTSRFRTFWRPLRILAAQRDAIAQKKADGNECRIADAHFEEGGDLPVFYWHAATEEYRRAGAHASTPVPPPPPSTTAQLLRAALDAVPPLGARSLRARVEEALRAADADADEGAQAVARELISRGRAERAEAALSARGDRPLWASLPVPGADAAWSPQFRFEHVEHDDDACTTYFSTTGDVVRAIYNLLNHHGYETSVPLAATSLRAALAAYRAAHGKDAVPGVEVSFTQSKLHLRRRRRGGRPTSLNGINRVALTMRKLRHHETFDKLEKDYNICTSTLERYFSHTIIALDNLFIRIFPPFPYPYDVAAALTPGSLVEKMGTRVPVYVDGAACTLARQADGEVPAPTRRALALAQGAPACSRARRRQCCSRRSRRRTRPSLCLAKEAFRKASHTHADACGRGVGASECVGWRRAGWQGRESTRRWGQQQQLYNAQHRQRTYWDIPPEMNKVLRAKNHLYVCAVHERVCVQVAPQ